MKRLWIATTIGAVISLVGVAFAASPLFDRYCSRPHMSDTIEMICDLNARLVSVENQLASFATNQQIQDLQSQIDDLYNIINPPFSADMLGEWRLDELSGSLAADTSGHNNNGTASGTTVVDGKFGNARQFNGSSDYILIGDSPSLALSSTGTVALWVKTTKTTGQGFIDKSSCVAPGQCGFQQSGFTLSEYTGGLGATIGDGSQFNGFEVTRVDDGLFHFLTLRWNGSTVDLFIDGTLVQSTAQTITPSNSGPIHIGFSGEANGAAGNGYTDGIIDEVRLYDRALNNSEILSLFNNNQL